MIISELNLKNVFLIKHQIFKDDRGHFKRLFCKKIFKANKINFENKQSNYSFNLTKYTLRGFHFQKKPFQQDKLITCIKGKIYDIILDLRPKSKTFLKWISVNIDAKDNTSILIPKGCANAWMTMKDNTSLIYHHSQFYKPGYEFSIRYNDPFFKFDWPQNPKIISMKDRNIKDFKLKNL